MLFVSATVFLVFATVFLVFATVFLVFATVFLVFATVFLVFATVKDFPGSHPTPCSGYATAVLRPSEFRDLVSGRRRGLRAELMRFALRLAEGPYALAMEWRNRRYDRSRAQVHRVGVPVVSVGNLTLGGTGKTPVVEWMARWFRARGVRVTIISRGYGAEAGAKNDEALELQQRLPDVPHLQDPDRVAAAELAIEKFDCQLIVLDDAFQHRRIARDLDVVLLDALEPFGFGHVFPRGTLREPAAGLGRADVVILTRADMLEEADRECIRGEVGRLAPGAIWMEATHTATELIDCGGRRRPLDSFKAERIAAFCGIGNPSGFRHTLKTCGSQMVDLREFPDHHAYDRADVESLAQWAKRLDVAALLSTAKDLVKLDVEQLGGCPLWAVGVETRFCRGQEEFEGKLGTLLP